MLGASLRHRGEEILYGVDAREAASAPGRSAGIPLLHPWANRLAGFGYRAAGREVALDPRSPLLQLDANGLPIHGVPGSRLAWQVTDDRPDRLAGALAWSREDLLAVFPFPHRLEWSATLDAEGLTLEATLVAGSAGPVPVSYGFHPNFRLPGLARERWRLGLPALRRFRLDRRGIPTGEEEPFAASDAPLGGRAFDAGFALLDARASFALAGGGREIRVELLEGHPCAQVYAPLDRDLVAFEPMTAPTNALASGRGLVLVPAGGRYRSAFRIRVSDAPPRGAAS